MPDDLAQIRLDGFYTLGQFALPDDSNTTATIDTARLIIALLALDVAQCSPNAYWFWNATNGTGACKCFFDRDCSQDALRLGHDLVHPVLIVTAVLFAGIVIIYMVVRVIYAPTTPSVKQ